MFAPAMIVGGRLAGGGRESTQQQTGNSSPYPYDARMNLSRRKDAAFDRAVAAYTLADAARLPVDGGAPLGRAPCCRFASVGVGGEFPKSRGPRTIPTAAPAGSAGAG